MQALRALTVANIRSFLRDRAALFWTLAFPIMFILLFGTIFGGGGNDTLKVGWVNQDGTAAADQLRGTFAAVKLLDLRDEPLPDALSAMRAGNLDAVVVVPAGYGTAVRAATGGTGSPSSTPPLALTLYTDPSQSNTAQTLTGVVQSLVAAQNQALSGRPPVLALATRSIQTEQLNGVSYFVPSILAMALMQLGVFAAIPLVQQRERLILKRLNATPLPRWTLVGSNVLMRLVIAAVQTALIIGIGIWVFGVKVAGDLAATIGFVALGALTFIAIGYVIASFARTEEAANGMTSIVQFPLMFLSGIFFPLTFMPEWLRGVATAMPLTYLGDALRQTMVGGTPFAPLGVDLLVLAGWLVACLAVSARFFRWQ
jgi:ABC-2 type transport system permease protein